MLPSTSTVNGAAVFRDEVIVLLAKSSNIFGENRRPMMKNVISHRFPLNSIMFALDKILAQIFCRSDLFKAIIPTYKSDNSLKNKSQNFLLSNAGFFPAHPSVGEAIA